MTRRIALVSLASLLTLACSEGHPGPSEPDLSKGTLPSNPGGGSARSEPIVAMTRNLYIGTDELAIVAAPPSQIPLAVANAWHEIVASDPAARMDAIAGEIVAEMPQVVGLQEAARLALIDPSTGKAVEGFDFLTLLQAALEARGAKYRVAAVNSNVTVALPGLLPNVGLRYVSYVDRDAILVRSDVSVTSTREGNYDAHLSLPVAGFVVDAFRGWSLAHVSFGGRAFTFANTHLESERFLAIQEAQARELASLLADEQGLVILAGDLNSDAYSGRYSTRPIDTQSYEILQAAGFSDVWSEARPHDLGLTCCHAADLHADTDPFYMRIDLLLVRSPFAPASGKLPGSLHAEVIGEESSDRTRSGLWPSDHAGLIASLGLPEPAFKVAE